MAASANLPYTREHIAAVTGMPSEFCDRLTILSWTLDPMRDWDGATTSIVSADNLGAATSVNDEFEALVANSSGASPVISWDTSVHPPRFSLAVSAAHSANRAGIQWKGGNLTKFDWTDPGLIGVMMTVEGLNPSTGTAQEIDLGFGRYTQNSPANTAASLRRGWFGRFFGGSANVLARGYTDAATPVEQEFYHDNDSANADWPFNRLDLETHGAFIWRSPANVSQSSLDWDYYAGTIWNDKCDIWSESETTGKAFDPETTCGLASLADDWVPALTVRGNIVGTVTFARIHVLGFYHR